MLLAVDLYIEIYNRIVYFLLKFQNKAILVHLVRIRRLLIIFFFLFRTIVSWHMNRNVSQP